MTLILASKSASRRAMLDAAGVHYESMPAEIDERAVEKSLSGEKPGEIARALGVAKARAVSLLEPHSLVLGSDSLVVCDGERFDKPASRDAAVDHLRFFSGKVMELHSGAALVRDGEVLWTGTAMASLHVRELSDAFIQNYLDVEWPAVAGCVGVFRIEAIGVQLFERIEGDQFTVLGMPLLPVLAALRELGELPE
ncbi:Maf family protein [Pontixanthobacter aquaemixtae]|uniref:Nucleoside triphosphate pyrophosphatase n=1 Tax=Pontixanthobacter aquaemixtae TaxID=1958940 RepID=A0A844ZVX9_9SPHN|nr:nucleoside triphosphate pyrophosphatase [Pontixanthobacter aquaemixtae]MXO91422.1 septum formation protein Maf [Pontixanthobacter aquaemixtae]